MVKVKNAKYLLSAAYKSQWPEEGIPEVCLAGRSNVGKSSFINTMLRHSGLAKVSSNPGKTRTLNFFDVNDDLRFVDVPGYGYANVSPKIKQQFGDMMDEYLAERQSLVGVILIVDYRHKPTKDDKLMYDYVKYYDLPVIVVATKEDKLKRNELKKNEKLIRETLEMSEEDVFVAFSSLKKVGVEKVWEYVDILCDIDEE